MVFKRLLGGLTGGPSVDTVLDTSATTPGGTVQGTVHLRGGESEAQLEHVAVSLVTRVEVESGDHEWSQDVEFGHQQIAGAGVLAPGQQAQLRFALPVPWETPLTAVFGRPLPRPTVGLRTDVSVARALDKGDLDPVVVHALPSQERVLQALLRLGFTFKGADVERGRTPGSRLPFYQELEFYPGGRFARGIGELELTFVTTPHSLRVLLEADRRGGFFTAGHDAYAGFEVDHVTAERTDWERVLGEQVEQLGRSRGLFF